MNSDFWLSRGPGPQNVNGAAGNPTSNSTFPQALMDTSSPNDYHLQRSSEHSSSTGANNGFQPTSNNATINNNNNENSSINNNNTPSNNNVENLSDNNNRSAVDTKDRMLGGGEGQENFGQHSPNEFQLATAQQNHDPTDSPVAENLSSDLKFNADKFVNEIQVSRRFLECDLVLVSQ